MLEPTPVDKTPACRTCFFWRASSNNLIGFCLRFPPTPSMDQSGHAFPMTGKAVWCGEHYDRDRKIADEKQLAELAGTMRLLKDVFDGEKTPPDLNG